MKENFKKIISLITILIISISLSQCQKDDDFVNPERENISQTKKWFNEYETTNENYELFQNLDYEWQKAEVKKNAKDGTQLIIVPIIEKKDQNEIWEQRLYIYKLNENSYKALLFEFYPDKVTDYLNRNLPADSDLFNGYITVWDLKKGFIKAAKFKNNTIVSNGVAEVISRDELTIRNTTAKVPLESNFDDETSWGGSAIPLRTVVIQNNYIDAMYFVSRRGTDNGGGTYEDYTDVHTGGGGSGSGSTSTLVTPPSCESFNFTKVTNNWQEALVKNVHFKVFLLNEKGVEILHVIEFAQPIAFGTPIIVEVGNTNITPGIAANTSARALQRAMQDVIDRYGHKRESELTVRLYFEERLKYNYQLYIYGGRVKFNATNNGKVTEYKTNTITGGDCR